MTTLALNPTFGLGAIQRAALTQIFTDLNDVIDEINDEKIPEDIDFETFLGRDNPTGTETEHILPGNFHEGHRPSLIKADIDKYPNCCVWTVRAVPAGESANSDHTSIYNNLLYIEVMVKANPDEDEEDVNRRIERTAEAVHICMSRDLSLGGKVSGLSSEPSVNLSDVFVRRERTSTGPQWFWQGARLEYAVRKDAVMPSSTPGSIFRANSPSVLLEGDGGIDQM